MSPHTLVARRPHFRQEENQLFFFLSQRPFHSLSPAEFETWKKLEAGPLPCKDLPDAAAADALVQAGVAEAIDPIEAGERRPILVVEPHCDDAALSIGATMWKMRHAAEFHLLTMASRSNYTTAFHMHRDYFDRDKITAMRAAEGELFAAHLGGHYHCAGMSEATLRYSDSDWSLDFFNAHEVATAISNNRRAGRAVLDAWVEALRSFLDGRSFAEIWIPLGAGSHSDHDLGRNAALEVVLQDGPQGTIRLYEDVPYGAEFAEHTDRILELLGGTGATLTPWPQDVTAEYPAKLSLLSLFASQFKVGSIRHGVDRSLQAGGGGSKIERLWTVEKLPQRVPEADLWIGAPGVRQTSAKLSAFVAGGSSARRVAIFAISASGRWAEDLELLARTFPSAKFVVYAGPRVSAEFQAVDDPRVHLHSLDDSSLSWIKAALREAFTSHRIVVAGDAAVKANMLAMLWPLGRKLVCPEMDHLVQALIAAG